MKPEITKRNPEASIAKPEAVEEVIQKEETKVAGATCPVCSKLIDIGDVKGLINCPRCGHAFLVK